MVQLLSRLNLTDLAYEKKAPPKVVFKGTGRNALNMQGATLTTTQSVNHTLSPVVLAHSL